MRRSSMTAWAFLPLLLAAGLLLPLAPGGALAQSQHQSLIRIGDNGGAPVTRRVKIGLNKSVIVEVPRDVREVMVSNPNQIDAVMQTSRRAFLIGMTPGEANIFFIDSQGRQMV